MTSNDGPLSGQHAFVTGGGSGIGLGTARALVADGALVTIAGRTSDTLDARHIHAVTTHSGDHPGHSKSLSSYSS